MSRINEKKMSNLKTQVLHPYSCLIFCVDTIVMMMTLFTTAADPYLHSLVLLKKWGIDAVLIGGSFMAAHDIASKLKELI